MDFIGDDHRRGMEFPGLLGQFLHAVVGGEAVYFVAVSVLPDDIECLRADAASGAEYAYLLFHISVQIQ